MAGKSKKNSDVSKNVSNFSKSITDSVKETIQIIKNGEKLNQQLSLPTIIILSVCFLFVLVMIGMSFLRF